MLLSAAMFAAAGSASAAGVSLDPGFGDRGAVLVGTLPVIAPRVVSQAPGALASDPEGRIILADPGHGLAVIRLTRSGARDVTFAAGGEAVVAGLARASAVAVDPEGRVLVAGAEASSSSVMVARLLPNGSSDPTFGSDGSVTVAVPGFNGDVNDLRVGRILPVSGGVAFAVSGQAVNDLNVFRLTDTGTLDQHFGGAGHVALGITGDTQIADIAVDSEDRLDIAVNEVPPEKYGVNRSFVYRVLPDGAIDATFPPIAEQLLAPTNEIAVQPDGRLLLAGGDVFNVDPDIDAQSAVGVLQRELPDGAPDHSFGIPLPADSNVGPGAANEPWNAIGTAQAVVSDDSGRLVALAGGILAGFTPQGKPDASFGSCGFAELSGRAAIYGAFAMIRQANGPIIIAGSAPDKPGPPYPAPRLKLVAVTAAPSPGQAARPHLEPLDTPGVFNHDLRDLVSGQVSYPIESAQRTRATLTLTLTGHPGFPGFVATATRQLAPCQVAQLRLRPPPSVSRGLRHLKFGADGQLDGLHAYATLTNRGGRTRIEIDAPVIYG